MGDMLVAPIFNEGQDVRTVYLPPLPQNIGAKWLDIWSAETHEVLPSPNPKDGGTIGKFITVDAPLEQIPVFFRTDSPIFTELLASEIRSIFPDMQRGQSAERAGDSEETIYV